MNLKSKEYLTKGKRSIVSTAFLNNKKVAIKEQRSDIYAKNTINKEAGFLRILNKHKIGPKLINSSDNKIIYEFVEGILIIPYLESKKPQKKILTKILDKCFIMDSLNISKEEMHNPYKHIFIKNRKVKMIDFERAHFTEKPKNVTQFCQFLMSTKIYPLLENKFDKTKLKKILIKYRKNINKKNYNKINLIISLKYKFP